MAQAIDFSGIDARDALDLAILIEEEAMERYLEFQKLVGGRYLGDASDVFGIMADAEAKHQAELVARRNRLFHGAARRVDRTWLDDVEAPDRGAPRVFMGPRQALEVALASEQKARDFFASAGPRVRDPEVKALFRELEAEELQHQSYIEKALTSLPPGPDLEEGEADEPGSDPG